MLNVFSCVWLIVTLWTVAHEAALSMGFSRQKYWSGLPCLPPGDLPDPGRDWISVLLCLSYWQLCNMHIFRHAKMYEILLYCKVHSHFTPTKACSRIMRVLGYSRKNPLIKSTCYMSGVGNFLLQRLDSKYFRFCGSYSLSQWLISASAA